MSGAWRTCWVVVLVSVAGCLPARRDNDPAPDTGVQDAGVDGGADVGEADGGDDVTADAAPDVATVDTNVPVGCENDSQCKALVTSPCHSATCNTETGLCEVAAVADGAPCGAANKCLSLQLCDKGVCVGKAVDCDDNDPCTTDQCSPDVGCLNNANEGPCEDGDPCTEKDACKDGACAGTPVTCPVGNNACIKSTCDKSKGGCVSVPSELAAGATVTCDDGDGCTEDSVCKGGACVGKPKACPDDGNPCTVGLCLQAKCVTSPSPGAACDDGDGCTAFDACGDTGTCSGLSVDCDDKNPCTDDACTKGACAHTPNTATCDDDNACTDKDVCAAGKCTAGKALVCDDGFLCTNDTCDAKLGGCVHKNNGKACNDGDACTSGDTCVIGLQGGAVCAGNKTQCDDKNPCTSDSCKAGVGCVSSTVKNTTACKTSGGTPKDGACWAGTCVAPECKNGICEVNENTSTCVDDCPAGGGACKVDDATCLVGCQSQRCDAEAKACTGDAKCPAVKTCMDACKDDVCRAKCAAANPATSVALYHKLGYCLLTKCYKNEWNGKPCTGASATASCIDACGTGVCPVERLDCYGETGCKAILDCQAKCANNDNTCPPACVKAQGQQSQALFITYDDCLAAKCK